MSSRKIQEGDLGNNVKFELHGRAEGEPEFYADGIHGVQIGGPTIKFNLYTLGIDSTPQFQRRESVARVVMSTAQFVGMVDFLNQFVKQLRDVARQAAAQAPATAPKQ